jgi:protease PrsW
MGLLALSVAPGIAICIYIYFKDKYNTEPIWMLLMAFVLGIISVFPAIIVQKLYDPHAAVIGSSNTALVAFFAYCVVALSEEGSKFLMLRLFLFPRMHFDDPFDGVVYAVMVGMGFATIENIGYVYQHGFTTGVLRMFLSVPAHGTFAVLMGYFVGFAKFNKRWRWGYLSLSIVIPVLFHGTYDFFLFLGSGGLLALGAFVSLLVALLLSFRAIRSKQRISKLYYEKKNGLPENQISQ